MSLSLSLPGMDREDGISALRDNCSQSDRTSFCTGSNKIYNGLPISVNRNPMQRVVVNETPLWQRINSLYGFKIHCSIPGFP